MLHTLFVYGTLKCGFGNHQLLEGAEFLGKAVTEEKYALYVASIPYVVKGEPVSVIHGEVYLVDGVTLAQLDRLEGHPRWYRREETRVVVGGNEGEKVRSAWLYFYPEKTGQLVRSGIYE